VIIILLLTFSTLRSASRIFAAGIRGIEAAIPYIIIPNACSPWEGASILSDGAWEGV
jgi:hypothetical protein